MEKKRTRAQDAAKGLMIIAVVFFHCYLTTFDNTIDGLGSFNPLFRKDYTIIKNQTNF